MSEWIDNNEVVTIWSGEYHQSAFLEEVFDDRMTQGFFFGFWHREEPIGIVGLKNWTVI